MVNDGAWPGSRTQLVDATNLGPYRAEVRDVTSGQLLYSRGFASVYGEWETTAEARTVAPLVPRVGAVPLAGAPVRVEIQKRQASNNEFATVWSTDVDPGVAFRERRERRPREGTVWTVFDSGPAASKVDLLLIGEGYTQAELTKFHRDAKRLVDALFAQEPFRSRRGDFNVRGLDLPSPESGVNRPNAGVFRRTPLSAEYNIFDSERYVLTLDNRALRDAAAAAPYEFIEILVNERTYGGGGIFNDQATASVDSALLRVRVRPRVRPPFRRRSPTSTTRRTSPMRPAPPIKKEPWEPNVTALLDPAALKWRDLVTPGTPLPTPWPKGEFEEQSRTFQAQAAGDSRAERAGRRDGCALHAPARRRRAAAEIGPVRPRSARSRARPTRRAGSTGRRRTASCSPATGSDSARSAAARSAGSSISTRDSDTSGLGSGVTRGNQPLGSAIVATEHRISKTEQRRDRRR